MLCSDDSLSMDWIDRHENHENFMVGTLDARQLPSRPKSNCSLVGAT